MSDISDRILELSRSFPTAKAFIEECEISNYSLITDIKKGRVKAPGSDILAQIVRGTGCSGTWLLTGEGEVFEPRRNGNGDSSQDTNIAYALNLLQKIEQQSGELKGVELPEDVDLQLARLLVKVLERR